MPPADRPRVGYVLKMYPRLSETFILNEILAHEAAGLDLDLFSLRLPVDGRFHEALGRVQSPVTYLATDRPRAVELWSAMREAVPEFPGLLARLEASGETDAEVVLQAIALARAVRARGITHLHAHFASVATSVARLAAALAEVPYSFTAHAKDIFHESVDEADLGRKIADAAFVVTVSDFNVDDLCRRFGADAARVRRIYNGLHLGTIPFHDGPRERVVLGVGRLVAKKGFADLLDAYALLAARHVDFRGLLVGGGDLRGDLEARIARLDLADRVTLAGPQPREEVLQQMRHAAVFAAPCVVSADGNRDGLPTVLIEAMALGTPCVSTRVTGIPEIVRADETGLLLEPGDVPGLADAIERLLEDSTLARGLARRARALVSDEFDIDRNTAELRDRFAEVAGATACGAAATDADASDAASARPTAVPA